MADPRSVERLRKALQSLPGVGPKSAQRMAFHLLERDREGARQIGDAIQYALRKVGHCVRCNNFSESELCEICSSSSRDARIMCVVETPADVEAIELAGIYKGMYFVLMGHISPMDNLGPDEIGITQLQTVLSREDIKEVILATNLTVEGMATADFISELIQAPNIKVSWLARGLPMGGELEYMDPGTLHQAFSERRIMVQQDDAE